MTLLNSFEIAFSGATPVSPSLAKTMIVVPCYNEADRLDGDVFLKTLAGSPNMSFVFVNDGSTDATLHCLEALQLANPSQIDVISLRRNAGKAEAVRKGLQHACRVGAVHVGYWDADLATPLEAIADFEVVLGRYRDITVVYGARHRLLGHRINRTISRRAVSRICASLARLAVGLPIGDTQCGATLLIRRSLPDGCSMLSCSAGSLQQPHSQRCAFTNYRFPNGMRLLAPRCPAGLSCAAGCKCCA